MRGDWPALKARLVRQSYLALPLGFSAVFCIALVLSDDLFTSAMSIVFLLLTPIVGAAGHRWR